LETMMARDVQSPLTSSCGRLFDAAAALLGFTGSLLYSAQAAMELEALAARAPGAEPYPSGHPRAAGSPLVLDPGPLLESLLADVLEGRDAGTCALAFQRGLARLFAAGAAAAAEARGLRDVFLTGGCLQNAVFAGALWAELKALGLRPHAHREIPPNDGGLCYGQAAWVVGAAGRDVRPHPG
jgi:hydrogenase maturation protein HypF